MTNVMCESLYDVLRRVSALVPGPTIYVTHHRDDAANLAEWAITLEGGRLISRDRPWDDDDAVSPALNASVRTE